MPSAKSNRTKDVRINVHTQGMPRNTYPVHIGHGLLAKIVSRTIDKGSRAILIVDSALPRSIVACVLRVLDERGTRRSVCIVDAVEANKTLATVERICADAAELRLERGDWFVCMGGGIVCDIGGLSAAVYKRGVRTMLCPTTLLAMVDASVGGKTAANLRLSGENGKTRLLKNAVGVFHQPAAVVCDVATIVSLPRRELSCGLAECIKHGMLGGMFGDRRLWKWFDSRLGAIRTLHPPTLIELVRRNVALKARVVALDTIEAHHPARPGRMMLNLGHTFGHALETLPGLSWPTSPDSGRRLQLGPLKHGEAVGLGLLAACHVSEAIGLLPRGKVDEASGALLRVGLPIHIAGLPRTRRVLALMLEDKKVTKGRLRLVLPARGCKARLVEGIPPRVVLAAIDALRA